VEFDHTHIPLPGASISCVGHLPAERLLKSGKAGAVRLPSALKWRLRSPLRIYSARILGKLPRVQISGLLNQAQTVQYTLAGATISRRAAPETNLRKAIDLHHQIRTVSCLRDGARSPRARRRAKCGLRRSEPGSGLRVQASGGFGKPGRVVPVDCEIWVSTII